MVISRVVTRLVTQPHGNNMPTQAPQAPQTPSSSGIAQGLDPTAVTLARSIRQVESANNYNAKGASGEFGAYQWMPGHFQNAAAKYLKDPNAQMTPANQDKVAYYSIKEMLDAGHSQSQVASMWNSGSPDWQGKVGVNKFGVKYDVPAYVNNVKNAYMALTQGAGASQFKKPQPGGPDVPTAPSAPQNPLDSFLNSGFSKAIQSIFPGQKIGDLIGSAYEKYGPSNLSPQERQYVDLPSATSVAGDVAQVGLTVGTLGLGTPETLAGRVGLNAAIGAGYGASGSLVNDNTNPADIAKSAAIGGTLGTTLGLGGEALNMVTSRLPTRIAQKAIPGIDKETAQYALKNTSLGTPAKMYAESRAAVQSYEDQVQAILSHPEYKGVTVQPQSLAWQTIEKFPNSNYTPAEIVDTVKGLVPDQARIVDKLVKGDATLLDVNELRKSLDFVTKKRFTDAPQLSKSKELAAKFSDVLRNYVQSTAKETQPIFKNYSKELELRKALSKLAKKQESAKAIGLYDIVSLLGGHALGGIPGSIATFGLEKAYRSPTVNMGAARALQAAGTMGRAAAPARALSKSVLLRSLLNQTSR